ncbi:MAG: DUF169 domain-containing protein [Chloroflexota bacterium]
MATLDFYQQCGEELEKRVRLKTYPLAIKFLEKPEDIPAGAERPLRDLGSHLSACQSYQLSRREGKTIASLLEDNWCFEPVVGYGLAKPPQYFLEGNNRFPEDVSSLEAGSHYAQEFPILPAGKYVGVVSAPLRTAGFEPDLVMIYCDVAQLSLLLLGRECKDGRALTCLLSSHASCVFALVPAMLSGECHVGLPCRGDHYKAIAADDEIIFTIPRRRLEDVMVGLAYTSRRGSRLPRGYSFEKEYPLKGSYEKIAHMIGYLGKSR